MAKRQTKILKEETVNLTWAEALHSFVFWKQAQGLSRTIGQVSKMLNIEFRERFSLPTLNLASTYSGLDKPLAPIPDEVHVAYYTGKVQPFVKWYKLTGEIVSNQAASDNLVKGAGKNE
ncbi:hypothetical protein [Desulforamulus aquiferis]|nr:hypothetical protein [Desulforamulus aquiferis]RYD03853.1 hypothetical protein N752_17350 [Desulforamulus aquiferis]